MQRFVQVTVALLNVAWIVFFLIFDPSHVLIQRRSLNKEGVIEEFCIRPPRVSISFKESNKADTAQETTLSNLMSSATGGGDETHIARDDETHSPPPVLDRTTTETSSTESSEAFPPEETHQSVKDEDALNPSPTSYLAPPLPHCCRKSYSLIPSRFRNLVKRREFQAPPECPATAVVLFTSSGEKFCANLDALWTDLDEETFFPTVIPQSTETEFYNYNYDYNEEDFS